MRFWSDFPAVPPGLEMICVLALVLPAAWLISLLHELGHVAMAKLCGWRVLAMKVGWGPKLGSLRIGDCRMTFLWLPLGGAMQAYPRTPSGLRTKLFLFALGGPLLTLAIGIFLVVSLSWSYPVWLKITGIALLNFCVFSLFMSLVPHRVTMSGDLVPNDGYMICLALWWNRKTSAEQFRGAVVEVARIFHERGEVERAKAFLENGLEGIGETGAVAAAEDWTTLLRELDANGNEPGFGPYTKRHPKNAPPAMSWEWWTNEGYELARVATLAEAKRRGDTGSIWAIDSFASNALVYGREELFEESLMKIEEAIQRAPEDVTLRGTKGSLLIELGRVDEGLRLLNQVVATQESEFDDGFCRYYDALASLKKGVRPLAEDLLRQAVEKYPYHVIRMRMERAFELTAVPVKST